MKFVALAFTVGLFANTGRASEHGLEKLHCSELLGPQYVVTVNKNTLKFKQQEVVVNPKVELKVYDLYEFSVEDCQFKPFSVEFSCQDKSAGASLKVKLGKDKGNDGEYHTINFTVKGIEDAQSHQFDTRRIEQGKASRCYVNETYEIR